MPATPDSTLAHTRRSKADLQRENGELRRTLDERTHERDEALQERNEAIQRETATAEVLEVINSSPGNLTPVFDAMLEKATRLCEADAGVFCNYDGECFLPTAWRGFDDFPRDPIRPHPDTGIGRLARGENIVHILDSASGEAYRSGDPGRRAIVQLGGARSQLTAALRQEDKLLGSFTLWRREVRPFTDKQIALLQNFAAQAVIAMENARLITETREALEQQTATGEVLQVINSSPGDLAPVFDAMLDKALRLCEASFGILSTREGDGLRRRAVLNLPPSLDEFLANEPLDISPNTFVGRAFRERKVIHIPDILEAEPYRRGVPLAVATYELAGARTMLWVPLVKDDAALGVFTIYRTEVRPFTDKQIALLENFAAQAVIAMENARLITETREALEQQTATAEVLGVINSSPGELAPVFDAILQKAQTLCDGAYGSLMLNDGDRFRAVAVHSVSEAFAERLREGFPLLDAPIVRRLLDGDSFLHISDLAEVDHPFARAAVELTGVRTRLIVPLRKDEVLLGAICIVRREVRPFTEKQIALLENFAQQAVIAMENARLLGELRQRTEEVAELNRGLEARVAAQLAELERTGMLRRFLAPQLADLIIAKGDESILESHRREIVVVFCDIRGFTAFAERAEPEEVMALLRDYHAALGPIVARFEGTLDHYSGDGVMVFFNDPLPTPEPAKRAIEMAVALREAAEQVLKMWRRHGHDLGFGVGISQGYATLGQIGFAERMDYTAIGTVCNLAARLCDEAKDGQILISRRVAVAVEEDAKLEEIGEVALKGLSQAVAVYNVVQ